MILGSSSNTGNIDGLLLLISGDNPFLQLRVAANHLLYLTTRKITTQIASGMPELLNRLEMRGSIVSIDAMGCQKEITQQIREKGTDLCSILKRESRHFA